MTKTHSLIKMDWLGRFSITDESLAKSLQTLSTLHAIQEHKLYKKVYQVYNKYPSIYDWVNGVEILKCKAINMAWDIAGYGFIQRLYMIGFYSDVIDLKSIESHLQSFYFKFPEEQCMKILEAAKQIIDWENLRDTIDLKIFYESCPKPESESESPLPDPFVSRLSLYMLITFLANWETFRLDPETFIRHICTLIISASKDTDLSRNILIRHTNLEDIY